MLYHASHYLLECSVFIIDHETSQEEHLYTDTEPELYDEETWEDFEDDGAVDLRQDEQDDVESKQSSETLSTLSSKRTRDNDDESDDDTFDGNSAESPSML